MRGGRKEEEEEGGAGKKASSDADVGDRPCMLASVLLLPPIL